MTKRSAGRLVVSVLTAAALFLVVSGCQEDNAPFGPPPILQPPPTTNQITFSMSPILLAITSSTAPPACSLTITARNSAGAIATGVGLSVTSSNPSVASIQSTGSNPLTVTITAHAPGTTTLNATDTAGDTASVTVSVVANGILDLITGAHTSDGFTATLNPGTLTPGTITAPMVSSNSINGTSGGTANLTVGEAVPITDILIGVPGQPNFLDIPVTGTAATRQSIINGFNTTLNIAPNLCQTSFVVSFVVKDAAGNFSQATPVTIHLNGGGGTTTTTTGTTTGTGTVGTGV